MPRAIVLVLDSFGVGATADADKFGDVGSDTLGHIAEECAAGRADVERSGPLNLPNLSKMGLLHAHRNSTGKWAAGMPEVPVTAGAYGYARELSSGKDTPSGHWEMAGVPVLFDWGYFSEHENSFPQELLDKLIEEADLPGVLGNCHASGTQILADLGEEHMRTGKPIVYTSADSVFQIACHEETYGLDNLIKLCEISRKLLDEYNIGRVIARPFVGTCAGDFARTGNRRDFSVLPPAPTLLDRLADNGGEVVSVGKIADIFAHQGITRKVKATGLDALFNTTLEEVERASDNTLVFTNFVDFDSAWGHRRDTAGYAAGLEEFDARLPELLEKLQPGDLLVMTADHGCDPTWHGTDHTREHVPVIFAGPGVKPVDLGERETFADLGQTLAEHFSLPDLDYGKSFLKDIL
ncbi:phosphopentomutase [Sansalvadorimonas sp. 2012CJ34-2]|uniref:Phosphopentomutase n=1 Tax=Parendozoicomonas callyspongiae TaxID=2942213 RepID=A0ABT0PH04_9GAMM|nr:phosphopentomutase [Sansalvadorimonas sp. 2012CJ34-2]MCL6270664.1 phosphopentomutase [Sansalvadorimonas sp. 2012CJ34-2]